MVEAGNFLYDSDVYNDDLPYWSPDYPGLLLIPYSLDTNDSRFGRRDHGYRLAAEFLTYLKDSFDILYAEGETRPKMMTIGLYARLIGRPGRIGGLHEFLDACRDTTASGFAVGTTWRVTGPGIIPIVTPEAC